MSSPFSIKKQVYQKIQKSLEPDYVIQKRYKFFNVMNNTEFISRVTKLDQTKKQLSFIDPYDPDNMDILGFDNVERFDELDIMNSPEYKDKLFDTTVYYRKNYLYDIVHKKKPIVYGFIERSDFKLIE